MCGPFYEDRRADPTTDALTDVYDDERAACLYPCAEGNAMAADDFPGDPMSCALRSGYLDYVATQTAGCPGGCSKEQGRGKCTFVGRGPRRCLCNNGWAGSDCSKFRGRGRSHLLRTMWFALS